MKIIGITQARIGSSRLPGKVLLTVNGKTLLEYHLERAKKSKLVNQWLVATTQEEGAEAICDIATQLGIGSYRGSLEDVLDRFYQSVKDEGPDYVVRITSDCPLIDAGLIDQTIQFCLDNQLDYHSNQSQEAYPDGLDVEVFSFKALSEAWHSATAIADREHVTPFIRRNARTKVANEGIDKKYASLRITVDEPSDFVLIRHLIEHLGADLPWKPYADYIVQHQDIQNINYTIFRNEGYMKSKFNEIQLRNITNFQASDEYRKTIHNLIPGGGHTYSKGDDQFPVLSPAAIVRGKGSHLWDVDGNEFLDCSMGLTSVSLGHAYEPVLEAVRKELENGVNFQRPSALEKEMAEEFLALVPGHDMVKFSKNGSIVTTAAVKLARAKTGRNLVAFPGDHPFYSYDDWFIGSTACNKGVPDDVSKLSVTFQSFNIESLKELFAKYPNQIACVITEPEKGNYPHLNNPDFNAGTFLQEAIDLCHANGALFIADEMVTGFKTDFPGSITKYGLKPDMATWGKGIANGFSFCALTGTKEIMELGGITREGEEKVFLISTTHGGETHGLAAAIATIKEYREKDVIAHNHSIGKKLAELCQQLVTESGLADSIEVVPAEWMPFFVFKDASGIASQGYRTLFMQEMIKRGVLFQGAFVPCFSHTEDDVYYFAKAFSESLPVYKEALAQGFEKFLVGEPAKAVFRKTL
ncbi:glutamate-1-semialdehyde 2,1-aminomutase [Flavobacterium humi]|uniref:Glutamate-1-semialdehyde 2,1-aminomutase n=1 Tax=Flavobacterium humi TaxID=2562683 RepID=A0A4Z0LA57_9FLAO|nr:glutamate-1-semialdehyde 2,1-aminomutase [Flavobacterium humi]TGD58109.1 glutamate-1-semialdehyde 2,1-aminomutase [Flavobacterium humi]